MKRFICALLIAVMAMMVSGCQTPTKKNYDTDNAPHVMTVMDETTGYTIYRHDETGVWYFCRDSAYGKSVCVMLNPDGTPYTGEWEGNE